MKQRGNALSAAIRSMGEGVIAAGVDGVITLMNPAAESWTGWPADTRNAHLDQVMQLKGRERISGLLAQAARTDCIVELPSGGMLVNRRGDLLQIGGTISPVRDHTGQITGATIVFGGVRDVKAPESLVATSEQRQPAGFEMIAESLAMQRLMHFARRVAESEVSTILLRGESGTGKDVVAKYLHYHSRRQSMPFLAINCAAIPETLLESELFGYEKGAFTDARAQKKGHPRNGDRWNCFSG